MTFLDIVMALMLLSYALVGLVAVTNYVKESVKEMRSSKNIRVTVGEGYKFKKLPDGEGWIITKETHHEHS